MFKRQSGQTIVELLVAIGLTAIMLPALATAMVASRDGRAQEAERTQATALLREGTEIVRSVREKDWNAFAVNGTYHPTVSGSAWSLSSGSETIGNFTRQVVVANVQRSSLGAIVASGGITDSSTKQVTVSVSWTNPVSTTIQNTMYFQRYLNNNAWTQTTQAEFNGGTLNNTATTLTGDGEVQLATTPGPPDWGNSSIAGSLNLSGTQDALDVFSAGGYVYVCDGSVMTIVDASNPAAPTVVGTYSGSGTINHVYVDGNYAYLSSGSNNAEYQIVNVTNKASPTAVTSVNLPGNGDATVSYVASGYAYVGRALDTTSGNNELYVINVTTPSSPTIMGSINETGTVDDLKVSGNYVYMAMAIGTQELTVVNATNKSSLSQAGVYNAPGTASGQGVTIDGTTAYLGLLNNTSGAEFFTINISNPASPALLGSYEVGGSINGVTEAGGYAFLATSITSKQCIILDVTTPSSPALKQNLNIGSNTNDARADGSYTYLATASNTQELIVITPTTTTLFLTSGTFESSSFDATANAGYNYLTFSTTAPAGTTIKFQVASNNDNSTWNYAGPDGTAGTYYTAPATIYIGTSGRYFRYKAYLTGTTSATPVLSSITVNYSP